VESEIYFPVSISTAAYNSPERGKKMDVSVILESL